jgi:hypothetical protein
MRVPIFRSGKTNQETKMKYALIGAAAVVAAASALPHWRNRLSKTPAIARSSTRMRIVRNLGPGNPYTDGGYYRNGWQNGYAPRERHAQHHYRARRG